jgi:hypothetical protein
VILLLSESFYFFPHWLGGQSFGSQNTAWITGGPLNPNLGMELHLELVAILCSYVCFAFILFWNRLDFH